jgi:hypothetical protein
MRFLSDENGIDESSCQFRSLFMNRSCTATLMLVKKLIRPTSTGLPYGT